MRWNVYKDTPNQEPELLGSFKKNVDAMAFINAIHKRPIHAEYYIEDNWRK